MPTPWPSRPIIYEINTWVWLHELSQREGRSVNLGSVPVQDWDALGSLKVDAAWLMGVWERSPAGIAIARQREELQSEFRRVLPDFTPDDLVGSPYCVRRYVVDEHLGGPIGLAAAREMLSGRGIRMILDLVPNHVAPDHPWVLEHPDYFIQGSPEDMAHAPGEYVKVGGKVVALGRDPYFPPWPDVVQLNAFNPGLRRAMVETISMIAEQCDGLRCDMAMLLMNSIFERTWGSRAGMRPATDYWPEVIQAVRRRYPDLLLMAEAYWDLEWELQQQGFDYCYDKRLYDRLEHDHAEAVRLHLLADLTYQERLVRFIENHDEPRAATAFSGHKGRAAAVTAATLPGASLFHDGQFEGRRAKLPVFLRRRPDEPADKELEGFYRRLLQAVTHSDFKTGAWQLCECSGWPDNGSFQNLVAWGWRHAESCHLVIVNLSETSAQGRVRVPWGDLAGRPWRLTDEITGDVFDREGNELCGPGLYVDLRPWDYHFLRAVMRPMPSATSATRAVESQGWSRLMTSFESAGSRSA